MPPRWGTPDALDAADAPQPMRDPSCDGPHSRVAAPSAARTAAAGAAAQNACSAAGPWHPLANHTAWLGEALVGYQLRRARRRSIGFSVRADGLVVTAPGWVPLARIEAALAAKAGWIVRKLAEARERADRADAARIAWGDGARVPFLGGMLTLRLAPSFGACGAAQRVPDTSSLQIALPADAPPACIRDAVKDFLMAEARRVFEQRLEHFAPRLGVCWRRLSLCNAATRWGSASSNGSIRLHWRLVQMEPALLDYVVVHELAHLRVMDHSPRFWAVVASVLPDHDGLRRRLKAQALPPWN